MPITWKNVTGPNFESANKLITQGGENIAGAFGGLADIAGSLQKQEDQKFAANKAKNTQDFLAKISGLNTQEGLSAAQARGDFDLDALRNQYGDSLDFGAVTGAADRQDDVIASEAQKMFQRGQDETTRADAPGIAKYQAELAGAQTQAQTQAIQSRIGEFGLSDNAITKLTGQTEARGTSLLNQARTEATYQEGETNKRQRIFGQNLAVSQNKVNDDITTRNNEYLKSKGVTVDSAGKPVVPEGYTGDPEQYVELMTSYINQEFESGNLEQYMNQGQLERDFVSKLESKNLDPTEVSQALDVFRKEQSRATDLTPTSQSKLTRAITASNTRLDKAQQISLENHEKMVTDLTASKDLPGMTVHTKMSEVSDWIREQDTDSLGTLWDLHGESLSKYVEELSHKVFPVELPEYTATDGTVTPARTLNTTPDPLMLARAVKAVMQKGGDVTESELDVALNKLATDPREYIKREKINMSLAKIQSDRMGINDAKIQNEAKITKEFRISKGKYKAPNQFSPYQEAERLANSANR